MTRRSARTGMALALAGAAIAGGCGGDDEGDDPAATSPEREKAIEKFQGELDELSEQQRKQLEGE